MSGIPDLYIRSNNAAFFVYFFDSPKPANIIINQPTFEADDNHE